jgi:hypothetical protein
MNTYDNLGYTQALIVAAPHCDNILDNGKVLEMRTRRTEKRGKFGLIKKGSGLIIGEFEIVSSWLCPLHEDFYEESAAYHQVEDLSLLKKWRYPWELKNAKRYDTPIKYRHPQGAVIWVNLEGRIDE